jgi:hypothetical protein
MFMPFHLLKNLHQESFYVLYFFFTLPPTGKHRWQPRSARAYMRVWRRVLPSLCFPMLFCQNFIDFKLVCQTVGVALL